MRLRLFSLFGAFILVLFSSCGSDKNNSDDQAKAKTPLESLNEQIAAHPDVDSLYRLRAELYLQLDSADKALTDIRHAIQLKPEVTKNHLTMADIYLAMGNIESCKKTLMKAYEMDPQNVEPSLKLAELYLFLEDYDKVFLYCTHALTVDEYNANAYFIKGYALLEKKDTVKALASLQKATQNNAEYYDAFIMLGHVYDIQNNPLAGQYMKTAVDLRPKSAEARYNYGYWLQRNDQFEEALKQYDALLTFDAKNKAAWNNIGYIYLTHYQKYEIAVDKLTKAIECDPAYADAYVNRGLAYEMLEQYTNARNDYAQALKLVNNFDKAIEGLNRIEEKK